ncbi:MAG: biopolymer transporter ExbD [bacterium]
MALTDKRRKVEIKLNLSPMIDVVFLILIYFIVSIEMEPSLDDRLHLADARYSAKQDSTELQIYILKASFLPNGSINPDSTGLIAFADRAGNPDTCIYCKTPFQTEVEGIMVPDPSKFITKPYIVNTKARIIRGGVPETVDSVTMDILVDSANIVEDIKLRPQQIEGTNKFCAKCGKNVLFVDLDSIPIVLKKKQEEILDLWVAKENLIRQAGGKAEIGEQEKEDMKASIALMIKADDRTFYIRILQVVNMAKRVGIQKFALVTSSESSWLEYITNLQDQANKARSKS